MSLFCCPQCGKDFFWSPEGGWKPGQFQPMGDRMLCEECHQAKEQEVEQAWQKTLRRANEN